MPQFKRLVSVFSPRRPGFDPRIFCIGFLVEKVALSILIFAFRLLHHHKSWRTWWHPNLLHVNSANSSVCLFAFHSCNFQGSTYMFASIHKTPSFWLTNFLVTETEVLNNKYIEASQWTRSIVSQFYPLYMLSLFSQTLILNNPSLRHFKCLFSKRLG
jgi:hypothetical protein